MRRKTGAAAAGLALAMVLGVSGAAVADGADGGRKPVPGVSDQKGKKDKGPGTEWLAALAKRYGVTEARLESALRDIKIALGDQGKAPTDPDVIAKAAATLGIPQTEAAKLIKEVFSQAGKPGEKKGHKKPGKQKEQEQGGQIDPAVVENALAKELGISRDRAKALFADLDKLSRDHRNNSGNAEFAAIAKGLGITPQQLEDALRRVKTSLIGSEQKPDSSVPGSSEPYKS